MLTIYFVLFIGDHHWIWMLTIYFVLFIGDYGMQTRCAFCIGRTNTQMHPHFGFRRVNLIDYRLMLTLPQMLG
jgi:hypothetical protein